MTISRTSLALAFCLLSGPVWAQSGFYLPTAPTSYGQDEFRAADGTTCRSSMDGTKRIELGAFGSQGRSDNSSYSLPGYVYPAQGNAGVYGRFTMSLDATPDRMNCNLLYRLEIERRTLELEIMKRSLSGADRRLDEMKQSKVDQRVETTGSIGGPASGAGGGGGVGGSWRLRGVSKTIGLPADAERKVATRSPIRAPQPSGATSGVTGFPPP